jgi:hypothetical protein
MKKKKRGRPLKPETEKQNESLLVMVQGPEKTAFKDAAVLSGASLSTWVRQRLRNAAVSELQGAGKSVAFLGHGAAM